MSNKTSDKNVANVTKSDIDILKALINVYEAGLPNCDELLDSEVKALKKVLAEREQDKKRIKELEEENYVQKIQIYEKYIPKQVIIDKMERHKFAYEELGKILEVKKYESEELKEFDFNLRITEDRIVQALQELLEGGNENG